MRLSDDTKVHVLKDGLIAEYHAHIQKWNVLQGAGFASFGLLGVTLLTRQVALETFGVAGAFALGAVVVAVILTERDEADFERKLRLLLLQPEKFIPREG